MSDQPVVRPLPIHRTIQTQNKHTQTSMPRVGFESTILASERAKTVHALDRSATVIGCDANLSLISSAAVKTAERYTTVFKTSSCCGA
jgi:hypothetical protein